MIGTQDEKQNINRNHLIDELKSYTSADPTELACIPRFLELMSNSRCFYRDCFPGHIAGSALLLNEAGDKLLMNHHKSLNRWLNFGGHADGEEDILSVAIRETMEESGLTAFKPVSPLIADLDIHPIPENPKKGEPAHYHYDIRYLMQMTQDQTPVISDESINLQWMTFDEVLSILPANDGLVRFIEKVKNK